MSREFLSNTYSTVFGVMGFPVAPLFQSTLVDSPVPHPMFNGVFHIDSDDPSLSLVADHLRGHFQSRPHSMWVAGDTVDLPGWQPVVACPAMLMESSSIPSPSHAVSALLDPALLPCWVDLLARIFQFGPEVSSPLVDSLLSVGLDGLV